MNSENYKRKEALEELKQKLRDIETEQNSEAKYYSLDELDKALKEIIGKY